METPVYKINRAMINRIMAIRVVLLLTSTPLITRSQTAPRHTAVRAPQPASARSTTAPNVKTDRRVYVGPPPPVLLEAGGTRVDPVLRTSILLVTDARGG